MNKNYILPISIIIAAILISGALIYNTGLKNVDQSKDDSSKQQSLSVENILTISEDDHLRGNPNAKIFLIEYSDTECPFCKKFHQTMIKIMEEYGKTGEVAWVYRHFPLVQLHSKARKEAQATECAAELGGNEKFWAYLDRLFEITPSNDGLDLAKLPEIAEYVGLSRSEFQECLDSKRHIKKINNQYQQAISLGARGTPYTIAVSGDKKIPFSGALPYETVKQIIEGLLEE